MTGADMLAGRAVLVSGGRGGIGAAIAQELAARGARVYAAGRPRSPGSYGSGIDEPPAGPAPRSHVELDVSSEDDWARTVDAIVSECGALYGLVNNAGVLEPAVPFTELGLAEWRRHLAVNLDGTFMGCRFAMRAMAKSGGGAIVNISSGAAQITVPDASAYCVSKSAMLTLTRLAAKAGGRHQVRVNAVLPGAIDTPMLWRNLPSGEEPAAFLRDIALLHPIGRIGTVSDVARAVAFLLDPANSFISGAMFAVDGGQLVG
jgi:NAD(P)-dependent dehydrogenase (short-subunit alcohol dehydrogenase family)